MEGPPTSDGRGASEPLLPCCSWCLGENSRSFCGRVGSATWKLTRGDMHEASQVSLGCTGEAASSGKPSSLLQVGLGTLVPGLQLHTTRQTPHSLRAANLFMRLFLQQQQRRGPWPVSASFLTIPLPLCTPATLPCHILCCPVLPPTAGPLHMLSPLLKTPRPQHLPNQLLLILFISIQMSFHEGRTGQPPD